MAIFDLVASPGGIAQASSAHGSSPWSSGTASVVAVIPVGNGSSWVIWQVRNASIPAGEAFNGITISGNGTFLVNTGVGITRSATLYADIQATVAAFLSQAGTSTGFVRPGTGVAAAASFTVTKAGFTSDNIRAGTLLLGMAVDTDILDAGSGDGTYTNAAMTWRVFTGTDLPTPAPTDPAGTLTIPAANIVPGVYPGASFASCNFTLTAPLPQANMNFNWEIMGTVNATDIVFNSTGSKYLSAPKGTVGDPAFPYTMDTGVIDVVAGCRPGAYVIRCAVAGIIGFPNFQYLGNLVVRAADQGGFFFEF